MLTQLVYRLIWQKKSGFRWKIRKLAKQFYLNEALLEFFTKIHTSQKNLKLELKIKLNNGSLIF